MCATTSSGSAGTIGGSVLTSLAPRTSLLTFKQRRLGESDSRSFAQGLEWSQSILCPHKD
uniref:Uncharacterized protein n=1 Tax=Arundo donax TaxID=35708 RepID=A0A0A8ZBH0_ARUDO